jgi:hypothetical protein
MFTGSRATHSGGGAGALSPGAVALMFVGALVILILRRRPTQGSRQTARGPEMLKIARPEEPA